MAFSQEVSRAISSAIADAERPKTWVADKAGIPRTTFDRKIRGRAAFSVDEVDAISRVLGISPLAVVEEAVRNEAAA